MFSPVHEFTYDAYEARQRDELTPSGVAARAATLGPGGRFRRVGDGWRCEPYPGHAVVTMVASDPVNDALRERLLATQAALAAAFPEPDLLYRLPGDSFHQTVANTLSAERFMRHVVDAGDAGYYPARLGHVLGTLWGERPAPTEPVRMSMIGLALFGSALGVLGVFDEPADFNRVLLFRERFYRRPEAVSYAIRRTRPFIGHVTLAYVGREVSESEKNRFATAVTEINATLFATPAVFTLPYAELRAYDHLAKFKPLPDLPTARF